MDDEREQAELRIKRNHWEIAKRALLGVPMARGDYVTDADKAAKKKIDRFIADFEKQELHL